jgi:hypothetical protein
MCIFALTTSAGCRERGKPRPDQVPKSSETKISLSVREEELALRA